MSNVYTLYLLKRKKERKPLINQQTLKQICSFKAKVSISKVENRLRLPSTCATYFRQNSEVPFMKPIIARLAT